MYQRLLMLSISMVWPNLNFQVTLLMAWCSNSKSEVRGRVSGVLRISRISMQISVGGVLCGERLDNVHLILRDLCPQTGREGWV